eukprot:12709831-Alexandrium_andersonii.AAC.1
MLAGAGAHDLWDGQRRHRRVNGHRWASGGFATAQARFILTRQPSDPRPEHPRRSVFPTSA